MVGSRGLSFSDLSEADDKIAALEAGLKRLEGYEKSMF